MFFCAYQEVCTYTDLYWHHILLTNKRNRQIWCRTGFPAAALHAALASSATMIVYLAMRAQPASAEGPAGGVRPGAPAKAHASPSPSPSHAAPKQARMPGGCRPDLEDGPLTDACIDPNPGTHPKSSMDETRLTRRPASQLSLAAAADGSAQHRHSPYPRESLGSAPLVWPLLRSGRLGACPDADVVQTLLAMASGGGVAVGAALLAALLMMGPLLRLNLSAEYPSAGLCRPNTRSGPVFYHVCGLCNAASLLTLSGCPPT